MPPAAPVPALDEYDLYRLWNKVDRSGGPCSCWPWTAAKSGVGYGRFKLGGKLYSPHRLIAATTYPRRIGDAGQWVVMHTCDNRLCCNPAHLRIGTQSENVIDMDMKGRRVMNPRTTYTDEQVAEMRDAAGSSREVARRYGVDDRYIRAIRSGQRRGR